MAWRNRASGGCSNVCGCGAHTGQGVSHLMSALWEGTGRKGLSLCMVSIWVRRVPLWSLPGIGHLLPGEILLC